MQTVVAPTLPALDAQHYTASATITRTLPAATGGAAPLSYTLTPTPDGLTLNFATRVLTGAPTTASTEAPLTYTVTDANGFTDTGTFMVTVYEALTFAATVAPQQRYYINLPYVLTLPEGVGGRATLSYTLVRVDGNTTVPFPANLTFNPTARTLGGLPIVGFGPRDLRYSVLDANGAVTSAVFGFGHHLTAPATPIFGSASIADQFYLIDAAIPDLTLPIAVGGSGTLSYTLTPSADIPNGLGFDAASRILSGTPDTASDVTLTYTATDGAASQASVTLTFRLVVTGGETVTSTDTTIPLDIDGDGDATAGDPDNALLTLPANHSVTQVLVSTPPTSATDNPPTGVVFGVTTDIALNAALPGGETATVCLPTTGLTAGQVALYHYTSATWNEIGRDLTTRAGAVCGTTATFSPFAAGATTGPTVTITDNIKAGTPGTRRTDTANLADIGVTFTFEFTEMVTGFDTDDIMVTGGGSKSAFTITDLGMAYTVVATPTSNTNDGVLTVTVRENAATGTVTRGTSIKTMATQDYDRLQPTIGINEVAGDDIININDQTDTITGTISETGTLVTLCFGGSDAACTGGTTATAGVTTFAWSYTLTEADVDELGEGDNILLRATAIDEAGNSGERTRPITVDTMAPAAPTFEDITGVDNLITAAERTAPNVVTISGDVGVGETRAGVSLCFVGMEDTCTNGPQRDADEVTDTTWHYMLVADDYTALGQGDVTVRATTTDAAGNTGQTGSKGFRVDTIVPMFSSGATGVVGTNASRMTIAYDADATDNGLGSETVDIGISYTLGGAHALTFEIDADDGEVRYKTSQADEVTHNIDIIATDEAGNSATQPVTISVRDIPTVEITDNVDGTFATGADITFTFTFSEDVDGFAISDITVGGGSFAVLGITTDKRIYTVVVSPTKLNDDDTGINVGTVTVTVSANAVTSVANPSSSNVVTTVMQKYDAVVPVFAVGANADVRLVLGDPMVYDAAATDDGGAPDDGITYTLGGTDALTFAIDVDSGEVTYPSTIAVTETDYEIEITATDKGGNTAVVTVTVTTVFSDDANLANLRVTPSLTPAGDITTLIPIDPDFDAATMAYTADVGSGVTEVTVIAPPVRSIYGMVAISGTATDGSTALTAVIPTGIDPDNIGTRRVSGLTEGDNLITIEVTAPDGTTIKNYTLTISVASAPAFARTIGAQTYTVGQLISLTLPTATGGLDTLTYTLTPAAPDGLTFSDDGTTRLLVGTPTPTATAASLIYTATDSAGVADALTFMVTINAAPTFDTSAIPSPNAAYTYIANRLFPTLTLPPAINGTGTLVYTLLPTASIPTGLNFDATERTLSGTPIVETTNVALTYAATDANGVAVTSVFTLTGAFTPAIVTSVSATDGIYSNANSDSVLITIAFFEAVTVSGRPQLALTTGNSDGDGTANYTGGSDSAELTFTYSVRDGDNIGDLAYTGPTALGLNSGTIQNTVGDIPATLTLPTVGGANSLSASSAVVLDNTAPVFTETSEADNRITAPVATDTVAGVVFYNADANDRGRATDTGISYTVTGTDFAIDLNSGALSPTATLAAAATTFNIEITATDDVNNVATQYLTVDVVDVPTVTITDTIAASTPASRITDTANIADGALTFTFAFDEEVSGFDTSDITVFSQGNDIKGAFATLAPGLTFTVLATPLANTDAGVLTVTVAAGAAESTTPTGRVNLVTMHEQDYDTVAPDVPGIDIVATDDIINAGEQTTELTGTNEADLASVTLCFGGTDSACTGGTERTVPGITTTTTTWSYTLVAADIIAIDQGTNRILRAIAADNAGNTTEGTRPIRVDTVAPIAPVISPVAGDNTINAAEQTSVISGTTETDTASVSVCIAGTGAGAACTGTARAATVSVSGTTWSYPLVAADVTAMDEGPETLNAYATDTAGNTGVAGTRDITVDTTAPRFSSGAIGAVAVGTTNNMVAAYDAEATDNGGAADAGITYTLGGPNANLFSLVAESGVLSYQNTQNDVTTSTITASSSPPPTPPATPPHRP